MEKIAVCEVRNFILEAECYNKKVWLTTHNLQLTVKMQRPVSIRKSWVHFLQFSPQFSQILTNPAMYHSPLSAYDQFPNFCEKR